MSDEWIALNEQFTGSAALFSDRADRIAISFRCRVSCRSAGRVSYLPAQLRSKGIAGSPPSNFAPPLESVQLRLQVTRRLLNSTLALGDTLQHL